MSNNCNFFWAFSANVRPGKIVPEVSSRTRKVLEDPIPEGQTTFRSTRCMATGPLIGGEDVPKVVSESLRSCLTVIYYVDNDIPRLSYSSVIYEANG
jgi:hypothetical protein